MSYDCLTITNCSFQVSLKLENCFMLGLVTRAETDFGIYSKSFQKLNCQRAFIYERDPIINAKVVKLIAGLQVDQIYYNLHPIEFTQLMEQRYTDYQASAFRKIVKVPSKEMLADEPKTADFKKSIANVVEASKTAAHKADQIANEVSRELDGLADKEVETITKTTSKDKVEVKTEVKVVETKEEPKTEVKVDETKEEPKTEVKVDETKEEPKTEVKVDETKIEVKEIKSEEVKCEKHTIEVEKTKEEPKKETKTVEPKSEAKTAKPKLAELVKLKHDKPVVNKVVVNNAVNSATEKQFDLYIYNDFAEDCITMCNGEVYHLQKYLAELKRIRESPNFTHQQLRFGSAICRNNRRQHSKFCTFAEDLKSAMIARIWFNRHYLRVEYTLNSVFCPNTGIRQCGSDDVCYNSAYIVHTQEEFEEANGDDMLSRDKCKHANCVQHDCIYWHKVDYNDRVAASLDALREKLNQRDIRYNAKGEHFDKAKIRVTIH
jgi:hypothetical protein